MIYPERWLGETRATPDPGEVHRTGAWHNHNPLENIMAAACTATVDVQLTGSAIRLRALELALDNITSGSWTNILHVAKRFETYIATGSVEESDEAGASK